MINEFEKFFFEKRCNHVIHFLLWFGLLITGHFAYPIKETRLPFQASLILVHLEYTHTTFGFTWQGRARFIRLLYTSHVLNKQSHFLTVDSELYSVKITKKTTNNAIFVRFIW